MTQTRLQLTCKVVVIGKFSFNLL